MGRKLNLHHLSEEECQKILDVIQRDFDIRQSEKDRLSKIEETIDKEKKCREILAEKETFNVTCCMRCCQAFSFFFNRKRVCVGCKYNVCKNCCLYDDTIKQYVCTTCQKHRELMSKSCEWFYQDVKRRFRRFGSAKVVRSLFKRRSDTDSLSEHDSGYDPSLYSSVTTSLRKRPSLQDDEGSESDQVSGADKNRHHTADSPIEDPLEKAKQVQLTRFQKELNGVSIRVREMLKTKFADDQLKLQGLRANHGLLQSYKREISIDLTNLAQSLYMAYEEHPSGDVKEVNSHVRDLLVKQVEEYVRHPVVVKLPDEDEHSSATEEEDDSLCGDHHPFEDQLADELIAKILENVKSPDDEIDGPINGEINGNSSRTSVNGSERSQSPYSQPCSNRVNPLLSPDKRRDFGCQVLCLPSFDNFALPLGKPEIDPDDLTVMDQCSDDFEDIQNNFADFDEGDDINFLEEISEEPACDNWTLMVEDTNNYENMGHLDLPHNVRRTSAEAFSKMVPDFGRASPMVGNRQVEELSNSSIDSNDILGIVSQVDLMNLSAESDEIAEITKNMSQGLNAADGAVNGVDRTTPESVEVCTDPRFEEKPVDVIVPDGEHAQLTCTLAGTTPIDVFWYRESNTDIIQLENDDKYEMTSENERFTLTIYHTTEKDIGGYICIAVNGEGQCSSTTRLELKENPLDKKPPEFLKKLEDVDAIEGQGVKFMVKVKGYPIPRVSWLRDGRRITSNHEYQLQRFGNRGYILTIDDVTLDNDAEYSVMAQNCIGRVKCDAQLLVEPKPKAIPKPKLPLPLKKTTKDKCNTHLDNLTQKVAITRRRVSVTADDVLSSAKKISSFDNELEEMDKRLNNIENQVTLTTQDGDTNNNNDWNNTPPGGKTDNHAEEILGEYKTLKKAAGDIRLITSTALDVLSSTERIIAAEKDAQTSNFTENEADFQIEDFLLADEILDMNDLDKTDSKVTDDATLDTEVLDFSPPYIDDRYERDYVVGGSGKKEKRWDLNAPADYMRRDSGSCRQVELADTEDERLHALSDRLLARCGVNMAGYLSNRNRLHALLDRLLARCGVNMAGYLSNRNIYMAAGRVFSLEDKIKMLETKVSTIDTNDSEEDLSLMEDQVAAAVARVMQSELQVDDVEHQVAHLHKMFSREPLHSQHSMQSEPDSFVDSGCGTGATTPTDLMSPKPSDLYNLEEEEPRIRLPSVRNLMTMFDYSAQVADSGAPVARVHSITGRDSSAAAREKYRKKTPSGGNSMNRQHENLPTLAETTNAQESKTKGGARSKVPNTQTIPNSFRPQARSSPVRQMRAPPMNTQKNNSKETPQMPNFVRNNTSPVRLNSAPPNTQKNAMAKPMPKIPNFVNPQPKSSEMKSKKNQPVKGVQSYPSPVKAVHNFSSPVVKISPKHAKAEVARDSKTRISPVRSVASPSRQSPGRTYSSPRILAKAAFWDTRINDGLTSDFSVDSDADLFVEADKR